MSRTAVVLGTVVAVVLVVLVSLVGLYNQPVPLLQRVEREWADVETAMQRRGELIPQVVETVKGSARFEQDTLTQVVEARAGATRVTLSAADLSDPAKVAAFQEAQGKLGGALGRLLATAEAYPELKTVGRFGDLMTELEGSQNRVATEIHDYNVAVEQYNTCVETIPCSIGAGLHGYTRRVPFTAAEGTRANPTVDFSTGK